MTSSVETEKSSSDCDDDGFALRGRRKRIKKILPDDFISSQDLNCKPVFK